MKSISRRAFIKGVTAGLVSSALPGGCRSLKRSPGERPNFVFFLTDDQRWDGMSCAGHPIILTPTIDRIAREGVRFENTFVTTALCGPSRASFLTGLYSHNHGVRRNETALSLRYRTFPEYLKDAGYETAFIGKWHNSDLGRNRRLDYYFGFRGQGWYYDPIIRENDGPEKEYKGHVTDILTDKAIAFLEKDHPKPFCLLVWFKAAHRSFHPAERFKTIYQDVDIPRPFNFNDDYRGRPDAVRNANMKIGDFADIPDYETFVKDYYRCLLGVDENVGRVLDVLDRLALADNTAIFFASDNGFFIGERRFFDKRFMYEESIRIPLLMRYPKMASPNQVESRMVLNVDLAPTILDLVGLPVPKDMDGMSFYPLIKGSETDWRKDFLYEYYEYPGPHSARKCRGIRTEKWKYIHFFEEPQEFELYNLLDDPHEMNNLIRDPENKSVIDGLRARMRQLRDQLGDPDL